jgi:hypothetical protein
MGRPVGLTRPKRLALGAATPRTPSAAPPAAGPAPPGATGSAGRCCPGRRRPPATPGAAARSASAARARRRHQALGAKPGTVRRNGHASRASATCTISGWSAGRPLAAKMRPRPRRLGARGPGRRPSRWQRPPVRRRPGAARRRQCAGSLPSRMHGAGVRTPAGPAAPPPAGATRRASSAVAPVTVRWPILRPAARLGLPYRCRCTPGRPAPRARRVCGRRARRVEPQVAQQVEHDRGRVLARRTSGRPASVRTCRSNCDTSQASML